MDAIEREIKRNFESARRDALKARVENRRQNTRRLHLTDRDPLKEAELRGIQPHAYQMCDRSGLRSSLCVCGYFAGHPIHES